MANPDLQAELKELRKQLNELAERQEQDRAARIAEEEAAGPGPADDAKAKSTPQEWLRGFQQPFEDLLHEFRNQLNEVPTASALTIFALGVLVGRLMPK